jgi:CDP-diacylglycerol pyrophosphatase
LKFVLIALSLLGSAGSANALSRGALWGVTQTCVTGYRLTGLPFPCIAVNIREGEDRGYAIVQLPFGDHDTVLMPTRRVVGIEDAFLTSPDAPNYVAMAWAERGRLSLVTPRPLEHSDIGLAINSRQTRSQDQLHIHIACVASRIKPIVAQIADRLSPHVWTRLRRALRGRRYWAYALSADDLLAANVFRLVAELQRRIGQPRELMTAAVLGVGSPSRPGFVVLAAATHAERGGRQPAAEALLDHACR